MPSVFISLHIWSCLEMAHSFTFSWYDLVKCCHSFSNVSDILLWPRNLIYGIFKARLLHLENFEVNSVIKQALQNCYPNAMGIIKSTLLKIITNLLNVKSEWWNDQLWWINGLHTTQTSVLFNRTWTLWSLQDHVEVENFGVFNPLFLKNLRLHTYCVSRMFAQLFCQQSAHFDDYCK